MVRRATLLLGLVLAILAGACAGDAPPGAVHVLTADIEVNDVLERYIDRGIDRAEEQDATAVVILIDTPGGAIDSMRNIVGRIEDAEVPVITYVSPAGSQAASAGTFIAMAGHIAAMAPSTSIGAATPVTATGEDIEGAIGRKVTNDTVAFARGVAELRGRNADWAEDAVREATSASASEAVELNVIDLQASSLQGLLGQLDGREVELLDGRVVTLDLVDGELVFNNRNLYERVLEIVGDPTVVAVLLLVGLGGLAIEFLNPGMFVPGIVGVTATIASFLGVGTLLPTEAAVAFLLLGIGLIALELTGVTGGVAGTGGAIAVVLALAIFVGQGSTEIDLQRLLTLLALVLLALLVLGGGAIYLMTRHFWASDAEPEPPPSWADGGGGGGTSAG